LFLLKNIEAQYVRSGMSADSLNSLSLYKTEIRLGAREFKNVCLSTCLRASLRFRSHSVAGIGVRVGIEAEVGIVVEAGIVGIVIEVGAEAEIDTEVEAGTEAEAEVEDRNHIRAQNRYPPLLSCTSPSFCRVPGR